MKRCLSLLLIGLLLLTLCLGCTAQPTDTAPDNTASQTDTLVTEPADEPVQSPETEPEQAGDETPAADGEVVIQDGVILGATYSNPMVSLPFEQTLEISWWKPYASNMESYIKDYDEAYYFQHLEEKYNVDFVFTHPSPSAVSEQFALMLTSEEYTDIVNAFAGYYTRGVDHAIEEGIIWALEDYTDYYPNFQAIRLSDERIARDSVSDNGHIWGMNSLKDTTQGSWWGTYIRGDLLDKYNLPVPVTYADWETCLTTFVANEPDMANGAYGMQTNGYSFGYGIQAGFNFGGPDTFQNVDGTVQFSAFMPGYRDYLELMADWWQKGLIHKNFLSGSGFTAPNTGEVGIWEMAYDPSLVKITFDSYGLGWYPQAIPVPKVHADDEVHIMFETFGVDVNGSECITTAADETKLQNILVLLDQLYTTEEVFTASYGTEGYTFNYDDNGEIVFTDLITDNPEGMTFILAQARYLGGFNMAGLYHWQRELTDEALVCLETWSNNRDADWMFPSCANMTAEESEQYSSIMSDISTYIAENTVQFMLGEKSFDEYDDFLETIRGMKIEEAIAIKQASLDRYFARGN